MARAWNITSKRNQSCAFARQFRPPFAGTYFSLDVYHTAAKRPHNGVCMEAMLKGVTRYLAGVYGVEETTKYMQFIINKSIKND